MWRTFKLNTYILSLVILIFFILQIILFLIIECIYSFKGKFFLLDKYTKNEKNTPKESREYLNRILPFLAVVFAGLSFYITGEKINLSAVVLFSFSIMFSLLSFKLEVFIDFCKGMWMMQQWSFNYALLLFSVGFLFLLYDLFIMNINIFFIGFIIIFLILYLIEFFRDLKDTYILET